MDNSQKANILINKEIENKVAVRQGFYYLMLPLALAHAALFPCVFCDFGMRTCTLGFSLSQSSEVWIYIYYSR